MFDWLFRFLKWLGILHDKKAQIIIIGLDNAGKTTLLHTMLTHHFSQFEQTQSFTRENIKFGNVVMNIYDLGGHQCVRSCWKDYYPNSKAIVFVIDASDLTRLDEAKQELQMLLDDQALQKIPILILGNKQDIAGCLSREELQEKLGIQKMTALDDKNPSERPLRIQMISAKQDFGYEVGFNWLSRMI